MRYLLDTNVCISILKGKNRYLLKRIENLKNYEISIPVIVKYELYFGVFNSKRIQHNQKKLEDFLQAFQIISFNDEMAIIAGKLRADLSARGNIIGPYDLLIAATALETDRILVTHNTKEFKRVTHLQLDDWEEVF
ncbi:MAG: type II toxin-antitoxin system VapC family toxin [Candidatus Cloacimonadota bacterium]|nr:type II toxin-antitoxin system VapC family toxin [Candidatus Cloacimonadota bacterium]